MTLAGAPKGCSMTISRPKTVEPAQQQNLSESFFEALTRASNYGAAIREPGDRRMSVTAGAALAAGGAREDRRLEARLVSRLAAIAVVAGAVGASSSGSSLRRAAAARPARRSATALREAAPSAGGLGGAILALQASFYRSLQAALAGLKESGAALWSLLGLGFAYGVFHAAGPGHGKAVIAAYLVANERALARGFGLSLAAALLQALVAILLVSAAAVLLQATAATMTRATPGVELASFAAVARARRRPDVAQGRQAPRRHGARRAIAGRRPRTTACDHVHLPPPEALDRLTPLARNGGSRLAAGIRPCAGALVILVFALSQGLFAAGIAATLAMALGTALTTGLIAALAVFAKRLALRPRRRTRSAGRRCHGRRRTPRRRLRAGARRDASLRAVEHGRELIPAGRGRVPPLPSRREAELAPQEGRRCGSFSSRIGSPCGVACAARSQAARRSASAAASVTPFSSTRCSMASSQCR